MKKETKSWLEYAEENLKSAEVLLQSDLFNPCLQSLQQAIEKYLKAFYIPSKYPVVSALPDFLPDRSICERACELHLKLKIA